MQKIRQTLLLVVLLLVTQLLFAQRIYWAENDNNRIRTAPLSPSGLGTSTTLLSYPNVRNITIDQFGGFIYYSETETVQRASLSTGTGQTEIIDKAAMSGYTDIVYSDNAGGLFCSGVGGDDGAYFLDPSSGNETTLGMGGFGNNAYNGVAANNGDEVIYYTDLDRNAIVETNFSGSYSSIVTTPPTGFIEFVYFDEFERMFYYSTYVSFNYYLYQYNPSNGITTLLASTGAGAITSIAVYSAFRKVYYTKEGAGLYSCDLDDLSTALLVGGVAIYDVAVQFDYTPPVFTALSPADNAVAVAISGTDLILTFDEDVKNSSTSGTADETSVRLYGTLGNFLIDTYTRGSANISIVGNVVTISGLPLLNYNTAYHVLIGSKVFSDLSNNNFIGIALQTGWNFTAEADQSIYYSRQSGNWNDPNTWSHEGHTGTAASDIPECTGCTTFIGNGHTVTLTGAATPYGDIQIAPGATLDVNNQNLSITGILDIQGNILNVGTLSTSFCNATVNNTSGNLLVVNELVINPPCGIGVFTLGADMVVLNGVTLTSGTLNTNGFDICDASTSPPVSPVFSDITGSSVTLSWTAGSGDAFIVARVAGTTPVAPQIGTLYSWSGGAFGTDEEIGTGNFVIYQGNGVSHTLSGLAPATTYEFDMYSFNSTVGGCYTVSNYQFASVTTCINLSAPTNPVDASYCAGDVKPSIRVDNPGSGRNINWYDAPTGGNLMTGDLTGGAGRGEIFIPDLAQGTFYAEQYDGTFGCASPTRTAVTLTMIPAVVVGTASADQIICSAGDPSPLNCGTVTGGNGVYSYQWMSALNFAGPFTDISGATSASYDPPGGITQTTYYQCMVYSDVCETTSAVITVNVVSSPVITSEPTAVSACEGDATSFSVVATGSVLTYQWVYDNGLSFVDVVDGGVYSGATTNQLQISDVTGLNGSRYFCFVYESGVCENTTAIVNLNVSSLPVAVNQTSTICEGVSGSGTAIVDLTTYQAAITGNSPNTVVSWFSNAGLTITVPTPTSAIVSNGTIYYARVTNSTTTCSTSATVTFSVTQKPVVAATPVTICSGTATNVTFTSSQPNTSYSWTVTDNASVSGETAGTGTSLNQVLTNISTTQQAVNYIVTPTANGCAGEVFTQTVFIDPVPTVFQVTGGGEFCSGGAGVKIGLSNSQAGITYLLLVAGNPTGITASPGSGAFEFPSVTTAGTYTIRATTTANCSQVMNGTATVTMLTAPTGGTIISSSSSSVICVGETVTLTATGVTNSPSSFSWVLPAGLSQEVGQTSNPVTVLAQGGTGGVVSVTPSNSCGTGASIAYNLTVAPLPQVEIIPPTALIYATEPATFDFTSTATPATIAWTFSDGQTFSTPQPVVTFSSGGTISMSLVITDNNGCSGSDSDQVEVRSSDLGNFAIKNVVTPNGDGDNDYLVIERIENFTDSEVIVLDRWGSEVFRKKGYSNDWSFTKGEELLPAGNYVCIVKYEGEVYSRTVTVIKSK